ncbi:MAG: response regulator [Actinobacteria bacterium]|nr:response regulator [Actinomycetota bacterium]
MPAGIRVLVVDDTDHVRRMLTNMLSVDGFEVVGGAADGPSAIEALVDADPDVVVIDYKMPAMDGLETARRIREQRPDQHVILYTAFVDEEIERTAGEIGVAVCVGKVEGIGPLEQEIRRLAQGLRR